VLSAPVLTTATSQLGHELDLFLKKLQLAEQKLGLSHTQPLPAQICRWKILPTNLKTPSPQKNNPNGSKAEDLDNHITNIEQK